MRFALPLSILLSACGGAQAQQATTLIAVPAPPVAHDGAHDFDSVLGNSTFRLHFMRHPLTGTPDWTDMTGTGACYKVWGGRAQLDTVELDSADGSHIEGLTLRLYDREARQWRLSVEGAPKAGGPMQADWEWRDSGTLFRVKRPSC